MKFHWKSHGKVPRKEASPPVILILTSFVVAATLVFSLVTGEAQTNQQEAMVEQQLAALASHLSSSLTGSPALSLADIRRQLGGSNESLLLRQLDEYLLEGDYIKLFSAGFERLAELVGSSPGQLEEAPCTGAGCSRSRRTKRAATSEEDAATGLNQTTEPPEVQSTEPMESVVLAPGLPRPPTMLGAHKNAASKRRQQHRSGNTLTADRQQQSINEEEEETNKSGETATIPSTSTEMPQGGSSFMQSEATSSEAALFQPEAGSMMPENEYALTAAGPNLRRRPPGAEHSAKLSVVPSPEQNPLRATSASTATAAVASGGESGGKSSMQGALAAQSLDSMLDNLDASALPDLSSILGQIQANGGDLENLAEYATKQHQNNGSSPQQPVKQLLDRQAWEPQLASQIPDLGGVDGASGNVRPLTAPYVALDAAGRGSGSGSGSGEFSVRQGALHEESPAPVRYSSQFGPIYGSSATGRQVASANLKLPAPLGGGLKGRNQRGSSQNSAAAKRDTQWTKINNNNNHYYEPHGRRPPPEAPIYPDSIQQQLYGVASRGASNSKLVRVPQESGRYHAMAQQQLGASNHHPRIIPMNYGAETQQQSASSGSDAELPPLAQQQTPAQGQVLGLLQVAAAPAAVHQHQHQQHQHQHQQRLRRTARRASPLLLAATSPLESALRGHSAAGVSSAHHGDYLHLYPAWPAAGARYSSGKSGGQRSYQHRIGHGEETAATIATTSTTDPMWTDTHQHDDDYQQSPQTIQITAVPNGLGLVGNGLAGWNGWNGFGGVGAFNGFNGWNGLAGGPWNGRQVLLVNKQPSTVASGGLEWRSWLIPVAIILALPLVLGALFVPVFLKSVMFLIQILQMLGILMPPSQLASHLLSGGSSHSQQSG